MRLPVSQALPVALAVVLFSGLLCGCGSRSQTSSSDGDLATPIKIGIIPYEAPTALQKQWTPFAGYVKSVSGRSADLFFAQDYAGVGQALMSDQIDAAYFNPLSYVLFVDQTKNTPEHLVPLAMPKMFGSLYYYGVIFTRTNSGINTIADLKGKKFAFTEVTSTSGHLYPQVYLEEHGIDPKKDFAQTYFSGDTAVVPTVLNGSADAGAVFSQGLDLFTTPAQRKQLKVLATVGPIANGMFVVRGNASPSTMAALKKVFQQINSTPPGQAVLKQMQVDQWSPPDDSVFDPVRSAAKSLGLNLQSMAKQKK